MIYVELSALVTLLHLILNKNKKIINIYIRDRDSL
nr:MAG TPA: hypothetical protein [Caudoviricetes sp.]